jgi:hypothetical protein
MAGIMNLASSSMFSGPYTIPIGQMFWLSWNCHLRLGFVIFQNKLILKLAPSIHELNISQMVGLWKYHSNNQFFHFSEK